MSNRRDEGLGPRRARMRSCDSSGLDELPRDHKKRHGGSEACAPFTAMKKMPAGNLTSVPSHMPKRKILHRWVRPQTPKGALYRAEARPEGVSSAICRGVTTCHQRDGRARASFGPSTPNKSWSARSGRTCQQLRRGSKRKRRDCRQQSTCQTARTAI